MVSFWSRSDWSCLFGIIASSLYIDMMQNIGGSRIAHRRGHQPSKGRGRWRQCKILPNVPKKQHEIEKILGRNLITTKVCVF